MSPHPEGLLVAVKVIPKSSRAQVLNIENEELKVRLTSAPEKGKANEELIALFAKALKIAKGRVILLSGETSRHKKMLLKGIAEQDLLTILPKP